MKNYDSQTSSLAMIYGNLGPHGGGGSGSKCNNDTVSWSKAEDENIFFYEFHFLVKCNNLFI